MLKTLKQIFSWIAKILKPSKKENLKIIALCIAAAMVFWFLNALNKNYSTKVKQPITFSFDHEHVVVTKPLPKYILIDVTGTGWNLLRKVLGINESPLQIMLDRPAETGSIRGDNLRSSIVDQLGDVKLNYVITDTIDIPIEERITQQRLLTLDTAYLTFKDGYGRVTEITIEPDSATFTGPESVINALESPFKVVQDDDNTINDDFNKMISLAGQLPRHVTVNPGSVTVMFGVDRFVDQQSLVRVQFVNQPRYQKVHLSDTMVNVVYSIREKFTKTHLQDINIDVIVDYEDRNKADSTIFPEVAGHSPFLKNVRADSVPLKLIYE